MNQSTTNNQKPIINLPQIYSMLINGSTIIRNSESFKQSLFEIQSQSSSTRTLQNETQTIFELLKRERIRKIF